MSRLVRQSAPLLSEVKEKSSPHIFLCGLHSAQSVRGLILCFVENSSQMYDPRHVKEGIYPHHVSMRASTRPSHVDIVTLGIASDKAASPTEVLDSSPAAASFHTPPYACFISPRRLNTAMNLHLTLDSENSKNETNSVIALECELMPSEKLIRTKRFFWCTGKNTIDIATA